MFRWIRRFSRNLYCDVGRCLNQIEIWFGVLRRKLTRYGSFSPLTNRQNRIHRFIEYYNIHLAHLYRWTCDGKLLCK